MKEDKIKLWQLVVDFMCIDDINLLIEITIEMRGRRIFRILNSF